MTAEELLEMRETFGDDNPVICWLDIVCGSANPIEDIDTEVAREAANYCNELVIDGLVEPRHKGRRRL